ncbi:hypothetical protein RCO28_01630 [Streptomyces sp. LHD-70]|uniref:hypothetical protein n=1 Tax=Streptomyces sp. LHD-70 TaxID=3072140 RepID=UPI00281035E2|nr:hypothetical protein [Streptomyces sp. LHD-70]MDQ8701188.1 hypothetical protein [Streptomyces sp. LHD-70]
MPEAPASSAIHFDRPGDNVDRASATTQASAPSLVEVRALIGVTQDAGLGGRVPARDVVRAQIRELSGYLNALRTAIATSARDPADRRQLRCDAVALVLRAPEPDDPTLRQVEHLRQLSRITGQFLEIAQRREGEVL